MLTGAGPRCATLFILSKHDGLEQAPATRRRTLIVITIRTGLCERAWPGPVCSVVAPEVTQRIIDRSLAKRVVVGWPHRRALASRPRGRIECA